MNKVEGSARPATMVALESPNAPLWAAKLRVRPYGVHMSRFHWLIFAPLIVISGACSPTQDTKTAEQIVAQFRKDMASESLGGIYEAAAPDWKKSISRTNSDAFLGAVNRKLGAIKNATRTGWRDNVTTSGHMMILTYHTEFEGGDAYETFSIRIDGDHGQLAGYHVNSMAMMVK